MIQEKKYPTYVNKQLGAVYRLLKNEAKLPQWCWKKEIAGGKLNVFSKTATAATDNTKEIILDIKMLICTIRQYNSSGDHSL